MTTLLPTGKGNETGFDRNNRISIIVFAILPGLSPNGNPIILTISLVWAICCLLTQRFPFTLSKNDKLVALCMSAYPVMMILGIAMNPKPFEGLGWISRVLPFFAIWLLLPRMRLSPDGRLVPLFVLGSGIGMILSFAMAVAQVLFFTDRAEGGSTNAALFGLIGVLFGGIALLNLHSPNKTERIIAIIGYAAGLGCALLSGTRSAWLCIPVHLVIFLWYFRKHHLHFSGRSIMIGSGILLLGLLALGSPQIAGRVAALQQNLTSLEKGTDDFTSLSARVALYQGAISAIIKDPLTGYGPQNRMVSVLAEVPGQIKEKLNYTHTHNGFLTAAVDAGIFGALALLVMLCAPIIGAFRKEPGPGRNLSIAFALLLTSSYLITGSFGIMFGQKALDAIFAFTVALICADCGSTPLTSGVEEK